jgi:hypothetical protein
MLQITHRSKSSPGPACPIENCRTRTGDQNFIFFCVKILITPGINVITKLNNNSLRKELILLLFLQSFCHYYPGLAKIAYDAIELEYVRLKSK